MSARSRKVAVSCLAAAAMAALPLLGLAQQNMDRVVVTGTRVGWQTICEGQNCAALLQAMLGNFEDHFTHEEALQPDFTLDEADRQRYCREMKVQQPRQQCDAAGPPPSVPGIDPLWTSNGCGDGSFLVGRVEGVVGDLNNPLPSVAFGPACMSHDQCYGMALERAACDLQFRVDLAKACGMAAPDYQSSCLSLTPLYFRAVSLFGGSAHSTATAQRQCAAWHADMERFQCPK